MNLHRAHKLWREPLLIAFAALLIALLAQAAPAHAHDEAGEAAAMEQFLGTMQQYLDLSDQFVDMMQSEESTVFMALEGITEIYEEKGDKFAAIEHLERLLERYKDNRTVRNFIHFKLRDLYKERGQADKALAVLELVIGENAK